MAESRFARLQSYFLAALDLEGEAREVYLEHLENEDPSIATEIKDLLANHSEADTFFSDAMTPPEVRQVMSGVYDAFASEKTLPTPSTLDSLSDSGAMFPLGDDGIPDQIGPYPVLEKLGAGGMGEVYLVQQTDPVKKKVALKVLNQTHISKEALTRFRAEAQTLALMQHHNIAQLYHYEARDPRLAYFTMEYIVGQPIHIYCEQLELTVEARLRLFLQVCDGVFHAHQKGIIHRDLKPNNILIATQDDHPVAKVIDFGIAKAVEGEGRDAIATMMTVNNALVGTPAYMPPEQVAEQAGKSHDVDTRSDIYSMGAILYQLLTDQTLIDPFIFRQMNWGQRIDMLRNPQVKKPSACLSSLGEVKSIAENRGLSAKGLVQKLSGDLDLVIMKCLAIDPDERYASVDQLRGDIHAWLAGRPVSVMPPSTVYRLKKYVKRNRGPVLAGALVLLSLVIGLSAALMSRQNAVEARELAVQAQGETESALKKADAVQRFLQSIIASPEPFKLGPDVTLLEVLKDAEAKMANDFDGQPEVEARIRYSLSQSYRSIGLMVEAIDQAERSYEILTALGLENEDYGIDVGISLASLRAMNGDVNARVMLDELSKIVMKKYGRESYEHVMILSSYTDYYKEQEMFGESLVKSMETYELASKLNLNLLTYKYQLASALLDNDKALDAEELYRETVEHFRAKGMEENYSYINALIGLSNSLLEQKKFEECKSVLDEAYGLTVEWFGSSNYRTLFVKHNYALYYCQTGRFQKCYEFSKEVFEKRREIYGDTHPMTLNSQSVFVTTSPMVKTMESGVSDIESYVEKLSSIGMESSNEYLAQINNLAYFYCKLGDCQKSIDILTKTISAESYSNDRLILSYLNLGEAKYFLSEYEEAISYYEQALDLIKKSEEGEPFYYKYSLAKIGEALLGLGRVSEAQDLILESYAYHGARKNTNVHSEVITAFEKLQKAKLETREER